MTHGGLYAFGILGSVKMTKNTPLCYLLDRLYNFQPLQNLVQ